jgi:hypothetical protein
MAQGGNQIADKKSNAVVAMTIVSATPVSLSALSAVTQVRATHV